MKLAPRSSQILVSAIGLLGVTALGACGSSAGSYGEYSACLERETKALAPATAALPAGAAGPFSAELSASDEATVVAAYRARVRATQIASLDQARAAQLAAVRCEHLKPEPEDELSAYDSAGSAAPEAASAGGASSASGTNNQVEGVDEADFVENDTKYLYVAKGNALRIIEAWPAETAHEIARLTVPGEARKVFVDRGRAVVYSAVRPGASSQAQGPVDGTISLAAARAATGSRSGTRIATSAAGAPAPTGGYGGRPSECTYGYDGCVPMGDGTETVISIVDLTTPSAPRLVRTITSKASFVAARRIGSMVHTVLATGAGGGFYESLAGGETEEEVEASYRAAVARVDARVAELPLSSVLPTHADGDRPVASSLYVSSAPDGDATLSVLSFDAASDAPATATNVFGRPGFVYASATGLYLSVPHQQQVGWGWYEGRSEPELSTVHKFALGQAPTDTRYVGSGYVKGRALNQFAMDEKDGHLRIATTTGHLPSPDAHNTLSVLGPSPSGGLTVVGQVDHVAPTEDIRSVRFDGDRGYVVTFKKTDPLYVFDLAKPTAPAILGELKIPGFSTYMHMLDATHLLTIGFDSDDQGDFAYFTGVLLQIFDVSNPKDPKLAHKEVIGTRGSTSEALTNHLAFNFFRPKNLLALPMTICESKSASDPIWSGEVSFSGLLVYDATAANGFALRGRVAHPSSQSSAGEGYYASQGCSTWWTDANSEVRRSVFLEDWVFSISDARIKVNHLSNLANDVVTLPL